MTLRDEIAQLISDLGITRYRAAKLAKMKNPTHLYAWLKGGKTLGLDQVDRLREALRKAARL